MPDFGAPIAQDVNVSPQQGIQTISGILGLKQQQQQLQTQTAQAQMATQQQQELKNLSTFTSNAITDPSYRNADGSPNVQKFQAGAMAVAPVFGQQYIGQMTGAFNGQVDNRKALLGLTNEQRQTASGYLGAFSADPRNIPGSPQYDPTGVDNRYLDSLEQARSVSDDPGYQRALDSMLMHSPSTAQLPTDQAARTRTSLAQRQATVAANPTISSADLAQQARTTAVGAGAPNAGLSAPAVSMVQGPKGLVPTNINPMSPSGVGPVGPAQAQGIPPQLATQPVTGAQAIVGPGGTARPVQPAPGSPGASGTGQPNWWSPGPGQAQFVQANAAALAGRIQQGNQTANTSPQAIDALTRARSILDQGTWTGGTFNLFKDLKNVAAGLGVDTSSTTNANELVKNLARFEAARAGQVGNTDAARALYESGAPNVHVDAQAAKNIVTQALGTEQWIQGYAKVVGSAPDPQTATQREQAFRSVPNAVLAYEAGVMRSPTEMDAFVKQYGVNKQQLAQARAQLRQLGAL